MMERWSVGHSRKGFSLNVYTTPAWTVAVEKVFGVWPVAWAMTRFGWTYSIWSTLMCLELRRATEHQLWITPEEARELAFDTDWIDDIMTDPDYLPDGTLKKELWR